MAEKVSVMSNKKMPNIFALKYGALNNNNCQTSRQKEYVGKYYLRLHNNKLQTWQKMLKLFLTFR